MVTAPFQVHSIQFNYDEQSIPLKDHLTPEAVPVPEFVEGVRNEPACYVAGTLPRVKVVFRRLAAFMSGTTYTVGATGQRGGIRELEVMPTFDGSGLCDPVEFELAGPVVLAVALDDRMFSWYAYVAPFASQRVSIGSAVHRLYIVLDQPTAPWSAETPWVAALDLACGWAVGATNVDDAARLITKRYYRSGRVRYDTVSGYTFYGSRTFNLTEMLERLTGGVGLGEKVNCTDSADTVSTLANVLGCDLWQSRMGWNFAVNPIMAIGYNKWEPPFGGWFSYHEVAWKSGCTEQDNVFDGCLQVDGDDDPTQLPHAALLPTNMHFGDCTAMNYRLRLCPPQPDGCPQCQPQPATQQRRPID
jgi:hypothetical protein